MLIIHKFIPYNPELTGQARSNRRNPTYAEKKFWFDILKRSPFDKYRFKRQKPLLDYIVDFYSSELRIEIDGDTHSGRESVDEIRTEELTMHGIKVIRYNNSDILNNIKGVYTDLEIKIKGKED